MRFVQLALQVWILNYLDCQKDFSAALRNNGIC
jgi:hypothetical protein